MLTPRTVPPGPDAVLRPRLRHDRGDSLRRMTDAVRNARAPIFFFQAENDYDLSPSRSLSATMRDADKSFELKIYPAFGASAAAGHSFAWLGSGVWADDVFAFLMKHCGK